MSSPPKDVSDIEKKTGIPPAVKMAGGVRVPQHHKAHPAKPKDEEEVEEPGPQDEKKVVVSGAVAKGDKDFPDKAVKSYHDKPQPSVQASHAPAHHNIQQPRK